MSAVTAPPVQPPTQPTSGRTLPLILVLLIGIAIGGAAIYAIESHSHGSVWDNFWSRATARSTRVDLSQPAVVNRIQQLRRLETVAFTLDKIVSGQKEGRILPDFLVGDRLLLVVQGQVVAGID